MKGYELKAWRKAQGYDQLQLLHELGIRSRQTLSAWENTDGEIPRLVHLAIEALEHLPDCRRVIGKKASDKERKAYFIGRAT